MVFSTGLAAETIFLRNGRYLVGAIESQTRTTITIRTANGLKEVQKAKIRRIIYAQTSQEEKEKLQKEQAERAQKKRAEEQAREQARREREKREAAVREQKVREQKVAEEKRRVEREERRVEEKKRGRELLISGLWRSAIFPGWGQSHHGRSRASKIFGGTTLATGALALFYRREYEPKRAVYESEAGLTLLSALGLNDTFAGPAALYGYTRVQAARREMDFTGGRANLFFKAFFLTWAVNLVDVVLFRPDATSAVSVSMDDNMRIVFRYSF